MKRNGKRNNVFCKNMKGVNETAFSVRQSKLLRFCGECLSKVGT